MCYSQLVLCKGLMGKFCGSEGKSNDEEPVSVAPTRAVSVLWAQRIPFKKAIALVSEAVR